MLTKAELSHIQLLQARRAELAQQLADLSVEGRDTTVLQADYDRVCREVASLTQRTTEEAQAPEEQCP